MASDAGVKNIEQLAQFGKNIKGTVNTEGIIQ